MNIILLLLIVITALVGLFSGIFFYSNYVEHKEVSIFAPALFAICGFGVTFLFKAVKKREESVATKLNLAIADQVKQILASKQPYQLRASPFSLFFKTILALALSFLMIISGLAALSKSHLFMGVLSLLLGTYILLLVALQMRKLLFSPIIQINKNNITHFALGEIPWSDISNIYLSVFERSSIKAFTLQLEVLDTEKYLARMGNFGRIFCGHISGNTLRLALPTSEVNAKVVEAISNVYAKLAGAPTLDTKLEKMEQLAAQMKVLKETGTSPENREKVLSLFAQVDTLSQEVSSITSQRVKEVSKTIRKMKIILALAVLFIIISIWFKLSK